ncbi:dihydroxyacetone kinase, L subunit [Leadbettera azotonutricia ZAS-9]|uniref:Dihydroxyacetone kinase, L subunit n=2 Tax=Leadbettera azotonutricia TaxID=150829 RepID=F5YG98_LEAAZ|nr:dihydroxyacetone kinase, L subunit [Leadbettera azotonutricia ZAS-9]
MFYNKDGKTVLLRIVKAVQDNKDYLSEVDGLIGDGDHGMNMNKGFTLFADSIAGKDVSFTKGLDELGNLLFSKIGGSMGPIYGTVFMQMAETGEGYDAIGTLELAAMLRSGLLALYDIVEARPGDKTLVDTLAPACDAMDKDAEEKMNLVAALERMKTAAASGWESTKDMEARFGRSSRLGERSRGVYDAGATSCKIILKAMADGILEVAR